MLGLGLFGVDVAAEFISTEKVHFQFYEGSCCPKKLKVYSFSYGVEFRVQGLGLTCGPKDLPFEGAKPGK